MNADLGIWVSEAFWGQGIAPAAVRALIAVVKAVFPTQLFRLGGKAFAVNTSSKRVFEKCRFVQEALHRKYFLDRDGQLQDEVQCAYSL